jgi:hypothetical protein
VRERDAVTRAERSPDRLRWPRPVDLDSNLVGVYLVASFALGGGDAASDCDFLVVMTGPVRGGDEHALRQLHQEIPAWPGY